MHAKVQRKEKSCPEDSGEKEEGIVKREKGKGRDSLREERKEKGEADEAPSRPQKGRPWSIAVLPPAGEAPAKRVMRERFRSFLWRETESLFSLTCQLR